MADQPGGDEGLADIGAGRGDEIGAHALVRQYLVAHDAGQPLDRVVGMLRREGQAQTRGAGGHGRRADGDDQEAFARPASARPPAPLLGSPTIIGTIGLCASGRSERAGEGFRLLQRAARHSPARARSRRARRCRPRRSPAAARSNRSSVRARLRIRSITGCGGAEIAAIGADRLRQRAHLQRHAARAACGEARAAAAADHAEAVGIVGHQPGVVFVGERRQRRQAARDRRPWRTRHR